MYTNVRSLFTGTKREELITLLQEHDIDILGLTETWGRSDIDDSEMDFALLVSNYLGKIIPIRKWEIF